MNNGRKDNHSSCFGRLYYRRLYLLTDKKQKEIRNKMVGGA